jgi:glycine/D-amino acid oxidase-like deaminating enzyme
MQRSSSRIESRSATGAVAGTSDIRAGASHARGCADIEASAWHSNASAAFESLRGEQFCDVAVVGAGVVGCSLALHLAEGGLRPALIDAHEPGWGASGRNAGNVSACRDLLPAIRRLPDRGERFLEVLREHADAPFRIARKHRIECEAVQGGSIRVAKSRKGVELAQAAVDRWRSVGMNIRCADQEETRYLTGSKRYIAAAIDESGGSINPYRFTRGLAQAVRAAGGSVFARSRVDRVRRVGSTWHVETQSGVIVSDRVILSTGAYGRLLDRRVAAAITPALAYGLATRPLPGDVRKTILPRGGTFWELPLGFHTTLIDATGRLITSLMPGLLANDTRTPMRDLRHWFQRTYPQFADVSLELDAYWTGRIAYSSDELPRIYALGPGMWALNGFATGNVHGIALGRNFAEALISDSHAKLAVPVTSPETSRIKQAIAQLLVRHVFVPMLRLADRWGS